MVDNGCTNHVLKLNNVYWEPAHNGYIQFTVRKDDRGFQKGDTITFVRWGNIPGEYSEGYLTTTNPFNKGKLYSTTMVEYADTMHFIITYVLTGGKYGIDPGYVVLGIAPVEQPEYSLCKEDNICSKVSIQ